MKRKVITTSDGSTSIEMEEWGETYHSIHGAIQEARHVYIERGFDKIAASEIKVLEMGFGTGLNAFLTLVEARNKNKVVEYHSIEAFPVTEEESKALNFEALYDTPEDEQLFNQMHQCNWNTTYQITPIFKLHKIHSTFEEAVVNQEFFDVIYFDVFGYQFQPDLWSVEIFQKVYNALKSGGVLATYACRGPIKRAMKQVGFTTEKVPGPPGKREMLVAYKQ
ncbi:tRNA (5-methylaminomethyl-2-thiouridine)(34)-methyltransferase MnmD [Myroides sp. M-43]|uniref:tRNA (5-methylaminomethyl-2-thiouridine)(34)-methyltransferase MnmD n=1 Tax=Myroides oncorhynchi TaxID=2893756 RepID=UPI001E5D6067|nr:tRNA (5-methylaminomethyl-2-thiouridine)(34)-methyltransferase MnmD [Myroides oncorhynchi]MCC9044501.1 tRNA (5-methylaminomethyl-2-thiouridine)(34)-methyltransferase MnmD [Myroides oncorhynchi]